MTEHQKAIIKALIDYDGRATNAQIYEAAKKYDTFGGKTPNNTIRRELQQSKYIRRVDVSQDGLWELTVIKDSEKIKDLTSQILELKKKLSSNCCVFIDDIEADLKESADWPTAKARIDDINKSGVFAGTDWHKAAKRIEQFFKMQKVQAEKERGMSTNTNCGIMAGGNVTLPNAQVIVSEEIQNLLTNQKKKQ